MTATISILDRSKTSQVTPAGMVSLAASLRLQLLHDVAPAYGITAPHVTANVVTPGAWTIVAFDDPDQAGALGYHDTDPTTGLPYGRIFVKPTLDAGIALSTVWSHEVVEAAVDPWCNLWASVGKGWSSAYEACDPVENDSYMIGKVAVSNFVTAQWFDPNPVPGAKFDHLGKLTKPGTMDAGGYLIKMTNGKVSQVFDDTRVGKIAGAPQPSRSEWRIIRELTR